jgi:IclR family KDG regulon transcriptional repressor
MVESFNRSAYRVPMVEHTFRILEALSDSNIELPLKEISSRAGTANSSTFRILWTLANLGYIERDIGAGKYRVSPKFIDFAKRSHGSRSLLHVARPYLQELNLKFNETVNFAVLQDGEIVYVEILESNEPFHMSGSLGSRAPIHSTAMGKAIAAYLPQETLEPMLRKCSWTAFTKRTITSRTDFSRLLLQVRKRGYAVDNEENDVGAGCVGTAILDRSRGFGVGAISISGPIHRIRTKKGMMISTLKAASAAISESFNSASR